MNMHLSRWVNQLNFRLPGRHCFRRRMSMYSTSKNSVSSECLDNLTFTWQTSCKNLYNLEVDRNWVSKNQKTCIFYLHVCMYKRLPTWYTCVQVMNVNLCNILPVFRCSISSLLCCWARSVLKVWNIHKKKKVPINFRKLSTESIDLWFMLNRTSHTASRWDISHIASR